MGNCYNSKAKEISLSYDKTVTIYISPGKLTDKFIPPDRVKFQLTSSMKDFSETFDLEYLRLKITGCVVPGQDPRNQIQKTCQDNFFLLQSSDHLLVTLFDGHGSKGEIVVKETEGFMKSFFLSTNFNETTYENFLKTLYTSCDNYLMSSSCEVSVYGSGTTAVSLLFTPKGLYAASVGDSRAILATLPKDSYIPHTKSIDSLFQTRFKPLRVLEPIQLTVDQKPNLEAELQRITENGGTVCKVKDKAGNPFGPYRVFQKGKEIPGLAMSRSLGDGAAKKAGVISTPMIDFYPVVSFKDQFIVVASDGVWDTMSNSEVTDYVETFRNKCQPRTSETAEDSHITAANSSISRLLAEESRFRWLDICSNDDIVIDDISAVVIEMFSNELGGDDDISDTISRLSKHVGSYLEDESITVSVKNSSLRGTVTSMENDESDDEV